MRIPLSSLTVAKRRGSPQPVAMRHLPAGGFGLRDDNKVIIKNPPHKGTEIPRYHPKSRDHHGRFTAYNGACRHRLIGRSFHLCRSKVNFTTSCLHPLSAGGGCSLESVKNGYSLCHSVSKFNYLGYFNTNMIFLQVLVEKFSALCYPNFRLF